uniref:Uncharacterized protein n=3 Tax=Physcomitrium patens TaxID=3218 RepID=A0A2K1J2A7_PHYPA|nr:hypothetical protein PHYPA_021508 [Physcomitrium patens]
MLYKEKKKLEVVVGYQLMANSAVRVLKGIQLLDELFTRKNFPKLSLR